MTRDWTKFENSADLLHAMGTDAYKWAESFCQHFPHADLDEDSVMGWFANAIMYARDTATGTIINGEHAQYLIEHGLTPHGNLVTDEIREDESDLP